MTMKKVSKLKRHFMALALTASFGGLISQAVFAGSSSPVPASVPSKEVPANSDAKSAGNKAGTDASFDISKGFSSIAEKAIPAVVNVSTTQIVEGGRGGKEGFPQFAPGSPFEDFFKEFLTRWNALAKFNHSGQGLLFNPMRRQPSLSPTTM
jgi:hypothetical protein